jgi:hypothetical protein
MSRVISELLYQIKADTDQFIKDIKKSQKETKDLSELFDKSGKALTKGLTVPLVAAGAGMIKLAVDAGKAADKILDLEQITGLSTDTLQEFKNVAAVAGVDFEGLVGTLTRFNSRISQIGEEGGPAADAVNRLGINIKDTNGQVRDVNDLFPEFLDKLNQIEDITERNTLAQEIFGRSLTDLAPVLDLTSDQIARAREEARELGIVQSKEALIAANNFRVELDKLKLSLQGQAQALGQELIPIIQTFLPVVSDTVKGIIGLTKGFTDLPIEGQKTVIALAAVAAALGPVLVAIGKLITIVPQIKIAFAALTGPTALGALSVGAPIVLGLAAVAATVAIIAKNTSDARKEQVKFNEALLGQASIQDTIALLDQKRREIALELDKIKKLEGERGSSGEIAAAKRRIDSLTSEANALNTIVTGYQRQQAELARLAPQREAEAKAAAEAAAAEEKRLTLAAQAAAAAQVLLDQQKEFLATLNNIDDLVRVGVITEKQGLEDKLALRQKEIDAIKANAIAGKITADQAKAQVSTHQNIINAYNARLKELEVVKREDQALTAQRAFDFIAEEERLQRESSARYLALLDAEDAAKKKKNDEELAAIEAEKKARIDAAKFAYAQLQDIVNSTYDNEIERIKQSGRSEQEKERDIAIIKRKQEIFNRSTALVNIATNTAGAIMKALEQLGPIAGGFAAGAIGALGAAQVAAVLSKPLPAIPSFAQGTRNFMVPPGFPNDSFPIMVQSGERVTVETPQQQAGGGGEGNVFQIGTVIADPAGLRELDRLLRKYGTIENIRRG